MLEVTDLHVNYGFIRAVKGISLNLAEGEIVALIGNNGAGKSTTLRAITGLVKPAQGSIRLFGRDIAGLPPDRIAALGLAMVPEGRRIFSRLTVLENLEMGAFLRSDRKGIQEDLERIYTLFPILNERRHQAGGTLSGGEQQMLAIGRALMARPKVLLLDEPSLGLAPKVVQAIFETIQEINRTGIPILLVEQNAYLSLSIANRGYVMETGEIILSDTADRLLNNDMVKQAYLGVTEQGA